MRYLWMILLVLFAISALAGVYTYIDNSGAVVFTDSPQPGAQQLSPAQVGTNTVIAPTSTPNANPNLHGHPPIGGMENAEDTYNSFAIASPTDQETIQNQPQISVTVAIDPKLRRGDTIQILLDGAPWGDPQPSTQFTFTAPDRGTHTLAAELIGPNGTTMRTTDPITVYIHQAHLGNFP